MSHHIYNTEGIILESFPVGESDKIFRIFTKELGLVEAKAQGIRKIESKNRYSLQDFSFSNLSFVRGRDVWRITNVSSIDNFFSLFKDNREKLNSFYTIIFLIQRLVQGEEKNQDLFDLFQEAMIFLKSFDGDKNLLKNFDLIVALKILNNLGYFGEQKGYGEFIIFVQKDFSKELLSEMNKLERQAKNFLQKCLEETQL